MSVAGTRRLCRAGLVAVLVTALCVLTLLDSPPQLPDPPADPPPTPADEKWLETIAGQLFLYSAHLDLRVAGYPSLRVIGVKRGPLPTSGLFCTVWYEEEERGRAVSVEALVSTIWLDEWGETVDSYAGILVGCQLPPDAAIEPSRVYVGLEPCHQDASHSLTIKTGEDRNGTEGRRRQFTLCIKGLDFDEDISAKIVAFVELHRILGAEHFYFYVFNVHANVLRVLRLYERSNVIRWFNLTLPGDLPNEKTARRRLLAEDIWIKRRMELIPYNHCFYDNLHQSEFVLPIDVDEAIVPVRRDNWHELLLDERIKLGRNFKDFASYAVRNVYFFPELQQTSAGNQTDRPSFHDDTLAGLDYLDTIRTACISPEGDSVKSFVSTRRALTVHNHYALTTLNPSTRRAHHFDPDDVLKHHHRACDDRHLDCEVMMEDVRVDESATKYADQLKRRMRVFFNDLKASA
ncbi:unnamed protein product [Heterotrigona itama]|uniref:Glycosyltransferase family 92 protein n=1 Tax=Heterotrigona itama TaxID=395501 RepID=A0A6V7H938_9HYME|nr:unnamed protein product [Heterotrigona itama]